MNYKLTITHESPPEGEGAYSESIIDFVIVFESGNIVELFKEIVSHVELERTRKGESLIQDLLNLDKKAGPHPQDEEVD